MPTSYDSLLDKKGWLVMAVFKESEICKVQTTIINKMIIPKDREMKIQDFHQEHSQFI